jgi:hypothetical protein
MAVGGPAYHLSTTLCCVGPHGYGAYCLPLCLLCCALDYGGIALITGFDRAWLRSQIVVRKSGYSKLHMVEWRKEERMKSFICILKYQKAYCDYLRLCVCWSTLSITKCVFVL